MAIILTGENFTKSFGRVEAVASVTRVSSRGKFVVYRPNGSIGK